MHDFSLINIIMNNGLKYSITSQLEPDIVIKRIKDSTEDGFITIRGLSDYVVLNKNKIVGIDVECIKDRNKGLYATVC